MGLDTAKAKAQLRTLTVKFDNGVEAATPFYPQVCMVVDSKGADESYGLLGSMPGVREWLGERQYNQLRAADFTIKNKHWESSLLVQKTDIADDRVGLYGPLMDQLAAEAAYHPDELFFSALIAGESTACFDGQYMFDTDHSWGDSGTQSNDLTYDATSHTAVTASEFKAAYNQARRAMLKFKNDQGKFLNRPVIRQQSDLLCIVPPELEQAAYEAFESVIISNSSNVVIDKPGIVVSPHCTDGTKFWVVNRRAPIKPFIFQAREPLSRDWKGLDDLETKDAKFLTEARYNVGYGAWWSAVLTTFN